MGPSSQYSLPIMDRWFFLRAKRLALKPAWAPASKEEAFATDEHGKSELEAWATASKEEAFATDEHGKSEPEALATVSKEEAFATDEHGKSEPEALATVSKEEAFATDEHGITRKWRIKAFSPRRRKERKGKQVI